MTRNPLLAAGNGQKMSEDGKPRNRFSALLLYIHTQNEKLSHTAEIARVGGRYAVQGHSRSL